MSADDVAAILGVNADWVYDRAATGELPSYKLGNRRKFRASEVEAFIQQHATGRDWQERRRPPRV